MEREGGAIFKQVSVYEQQIDAEHLLLYNPDVTDGIVLADAASARLRDLAPGLTRDDAILADGRDAHLVSAELDYLVDRGMLQVSGLASDSAPTRVPIALGSRPQRPTISVWLHITNACNLDCTYCYIDKSAGRMTPEMAQATVDKLLDSARTRGADLMLKFAGGEPIAAFSMIRRTVKYAQSKAGDTTLRLGLITNGMLITPTVASYLAGQRFGVAVSLDGTKEVNDLTRIDRAGRGSYDRIIAGIEALRAAGIEPTIMNTVNHKNFRSLPTFVSDMLDRELRFRLSLERDGVTTKPVLVSKQDPLCEKLDQVYDLMESRRPNAPLDAWHKFCDVSFGKPRERVCGAGRNYFAVGHDGSLAECGLTLQDPFIKAFGDSDIVELVRSRSRLGDPSEVQQRTGCAQCDWRSSCAGGCPVMAMDVDGVVSKNSPYCQTYKRVLPRLLRLEGLYLRDQLVNQQGEYAHAYAGP